MFLRSHILSRLSWVYLIQISQSFAVMMRFSSAVFPWRLLFLCMILFSNSRGRVLSWFSHRNWGIVAIDSIDHRPLRFTDKAFWRHDISYGDRVRMGLIWENWDFGIVVEEVFDILSERIRMANFFIFFHSIKYWIFIFHIFNIFLPWKLCEEPLLWFDFITLFHSICE